MNYEFDLVCLGVEWKRSIICTLAQHISIHHKLFVVCYDDVSANNFFCTVLSLCWCWPREFSSRFDTRAQSIFFILPHLMLLACLLLLFSYFVVGCCCIFCARLLVFRVWRCCRMLLCLSLARSLTRSHRLIMPLCFVYANWHRVLEREYCFILRNCVCFFFLFHLSHFRLLFILLLLIWCTFRRISANPN